MTMTRSLPQLTTERKTQLALPSDNMGVQNTSTPTNEEKHITLDYVRFTLPYSKENFQSLANWLTGRGERMDTGMNGYTHRSRVLKTGFVLWSPDREEMGIHVVLPAQALALIKLVPVGLINWALDKGAKFTRLDIAYDDFGGLIDIAEIDRKLREGEVVTRWKKAKTQKGDYEIGTGRDTGDGVTIGSRVSESYCRIYDKRLEREVRGAETGLDHWVRVELEIKGKKAAKLAEIIGETAYTRNTGEILANLLWGLLDFKDPGNDENKSRWATSEWWIQFLSATSKLKIRLPKNEQTLESIKDWWLKFVAPMTAVIMLADAPSFELNGYDWLMDAIACGEARFKAHHKALAGIKPDEKPK